MVQDIIYYLTQAWYAGAKEEGVAPDELNVDERARLRAEIASEASFVSNFINDIQFNNRASGGSLAPFLYRATLWANAYTRVKAIARLMASGDKKKIWTLHPAEHCQSCRKLDGKVKRATYWLDHGVQPKAWDKLACRMNCRCTLDDTDAPLSKGPLPNLP